MEMARNTMSGSSAPEGMTANEWRNATRFDSVDIGWITMSIGMAIGAGIVFLPVQVGIMGLWVFLLSSVVGYPAMFLFQKLFINTLVESKECTDYPNIIAGYLGKNTGMLLGVLYFIMLIIWVFVYTLAITNDSASYLYTFGVTDGVLSTNPLYGLGLICILVVMASTGEKLLFSLAGFMATTVLVAVAILGILMIPHWNWQHPGAVPEIGTLIKNAIVTLPFTLTSILFIQSLSPMVIAYRAKNQSVEVARFKAQRAMRVAFVLLFVIVFFYAVSFSLGLSHEQAVEASKENISSLAITARYIPGNWVTVAGIVINVFAVVSSFFGVFLGFREACMGLVMNFLLRTRKEEEINKVLLRRVVSVAIVLMAWGAQVTNLPILSFTSICSPIFGLVGCLIPALLVYKVPALHKYKGASLYLIIVTGLLLCISPILAFS
ncbi:SLC5/6 family protein [Pseudocitrobacter cyperus]|uniref:Serine transporter n=1 Tax=Pseudocitrobacter cyperus TaxID=3112843 RepID=A0ABV0HIM5_9ENTR